MAVRRSIDIEDTNNPFVVSNIRLVVNAAEVQRGDIEQEPGNSVLFHGYQGALQLAAESDGPVLPVHHERPAGLRHHHVSKPVEIAHFKGHTSLRTQPRSRT